MTATSLPRVPRLPRRTRPNRSSVTWTPPGGWARPTPTVLRAMESALARWSA